MPPSASQKAAATAPAARDNAPPLPGGDAPQDWDAPSPDTGTEIFGGVAGALARGFRGRDTLFGEDGADTFDFNTVKESGRGTAHRDVVMDFEHGLDAIDLSDIDANVRRKGNQEFKFIDGNFTGKAGQLHVLSKGGDLFRVEGDVNGDGKADFQIDVHNTAGNLTSLLKGDFVL